MESDTKETGISAAVYDSCKDFTLRYVTFLRISLVQFQSLQHIEDIEWEKYWNPKLYVENNLGEPQETVWQTLMFNSRGEATVYERRRIKGCFLENLELDEFPFDTQVRLPKFSGWFQPIS